MATKVTIKGQVTLPKQVRDAVGLRAGDQVEVRATASGAIVIEKAGIADDYKARLYALANRRLIRGLSTEELMAMTRGGPALDPPPNK